MESFLRLVKDISNSGLIAHLFLYNYNGERVLRINDSLNINIQASFGMPSHSMSKISPTEFLDYLRRSELLEQDVLESTLTEIRNRAPEILGDIELLTTEFVNRNLLTHWHIRQLLKKKYKGYYLRQYRILGYLGAGGMSSVYLAEHTVMKRRVAIKVLPKRRLNSVYLDRFAREARAIASLDSNHIVRAYDIDRFEDVHYIVMEYFEGQNLRQRVETGGPLAYEDAANYIRQAALGLSDAHKRGIIHRDVKPENIIVNDRDFVKVLDLGLALLDERLFKGSIPDEDKILGTADYLAPEQALDSHRVDARADIYGLGATLYFCLTGSPPFPFGTISERLLAHQRKEPASIFNERPDAPVDLVEICAKMMAKKPERRIQTAEHVADVMKIWLIRNGFAHPNEFALDDKASETLNELENLVSNSTAEQVFLQNREIATEIGFGRDANLFSQDKKDLPFSLNLQNDESKISFDSLDNGDASSTRENSPSDKLILSNKTGKSSFIDHFESTLNEIASSQSSSASYAINLHGDLNQKINQKGNSSTQGSESSTNTTGERRKTPEKDFVEFHSPSMRTDKFLPKEGMVRSSEGSLPWYKEVPIWFWTIVVGGYALAIFLAGVLFTLLLNL